MLTDTACRNATCPEGVKRFRLHDSKGLYLEISPGGSRRWFYKFITDGRETRLALGGYPETSLKKARDGRDEARVMRREGKNPVQERRATKIATRLASAATFEVTARELHASKAGVTWGTTHAQQWIRALEKDLFPRLGDLPLAAVSAPVLLEALRRVEHRGAIVMAHDLREYAGQVFRYGIATGRCATDPAASLRGALKAFVERNVAALQDPAAVGALMRGIDTYQGQPATRAALMLSALTFQRPGNIRAMEWAEIDAEGATWTIPAAKMKRSIHGKVNGRPHLVPLSSQALAVLADMRPLTGHGRYVFPSLLTGERCMSENTVRGALRRLGLGADEMSAHGFRAMARTLVAENLPGIHADVVEAQLGHTKTGPLGTAYDRSEYVAQRRELMQRWADYLGRLRIGAEVIQLRKA